MQTDQIRVVSTASNGKQAFEKCKVYKPDVVLMDMRMPEYDGGYGISAIKSEMPHIKILVLTTFDDDETVAKAISCGADGYILKELEDEQVILAIKNVYAGNSVFGNKILNSIKNQYTQQTKPKGTMSSQELSDKDFLSYSTKTHITFSEKEINILKLVSQGYDNKEIAKALFVAEGTMRNSISKLLEKVEVKDRTQLAVYAVKNDLDL